VQDDAVDAVSGCASVVDLPSVSGCAAVVNAVDVCDVEVQGGSASSSAESCVQAPQPSQIEQEILSGGVDVVDCN